MPKARSLASALKKSAAATPAWCASATRMQRVRASVKKARKHGYDIRPTDHRSLSAKKARALLRVNKQLFRQCKFHQIQSAVTQSRNNDRVVVMPGLYTERHSRRQPTFDPACHEVHDPVRQRRPRRALARLPDPLPQRREPRGGDRPRPRHRTGSGTAARRPPRHPQCGQCIRCNLQLEGSGVSADDVIVEAGDASKGNGGPSAAGHKKDVGIFVDRADGFVLRNMTVRHAREHDIYVLETDGYRLDRFKAFYAGGYGVLTFVGDHGLIQNCDAAGNGDSGLYPGSGADSTTNKYKPFYPEYRFSQIFRFCDSHHNTSGFSGTNSHGTLITKNNFYDNALGYTTDVFTAPGHPGFPQHGNVIEDNNFYDNNFNPYQPELGRRPLHPRAGRHRPVARGRQRQRGRRQPLLRQLAPRDDAVRRPRRRGLRPDAGGTPVPGCDPATISTSYDNRIHGNTMGVAPPGQVLPNGTDFWWDSFPGNTGNCWWGNKAAPGKSVTTSPLSLPSCADGTQPASSVGTGDRSNEGELVGLPGGLRGGRLPGRQHRHLHLDRPRRQAGQRPGRDRRGHGGSPDGPARSHLRRGAVAAAVPGVPEPGAAVLGRGGDAERRTGRCRPSLRWPPSGASAASRAAGGARPTTRTGSAWCSASGTTPRSRSTARRRYGYGAGMPDDRATKLFKSRCSTAYAGPFALYKLYGAAAAFSAVAG